MKMKLVSSIAISIIWSSIATSITVIFTGILYSVAEAFATTTVCGSLLKTILLK